MTAAANKMTGVVSFPAKGKTWRLQFTVDSLVTLENLLDLDIVAVGQKLATSMRLGLARSVLWVGLLEHHPDISEREAGELIPGLGGLAGATQLIEQAFAGAFPKPDEGAKAKGPRTASRKAGTGRT